MTNELTQSMVDEMSTQSHALMGLGEWPWIGLGIFIFWIGLYGIGVIRRKKEHNRWLIPNAKYWMNIFKSSGFIMKACTGIPFPNLFGLRADNKYHKLTRTLFDEAHVVVSNKMLDEGWTLPDWTEDEQDCDDYAIEKAISIRKYIIDKLGKDLNGAVPVGLVGYRKDSNSRKHMIIQVNLNGSKKPTFFDAYAETKFLKEKGLSPDEIDSISFDYM